MSQCVPAGQAAEDIAVASPLGRGRFAPAAKHRRKKEILKGSHLGCVSAHLQQAEGRAWPAGPAGPAGSRPRAPAAPAESHDGEDAAARRSSPSLARAPSPCEDFGQGACSGQPLSGRNMRPARQSPRKLANTRRGLKDQSQTGHRTRAKNWRKGAGHCGRCCRCPRKAHPSGSSPTPLLMRHGDQRPVGQ